jgi:hypothetical protein
MNFSGGATQGSRHRLCCCQVLFENMKWHLFLFCILIVARLNASCLGGIYVYPEGKVVTRNPIFLIDLVNVDPIISQNLTTFDFKIVDNHESLIPVELLDIISVNGYVKQVLFRPMRQLQFSDTISLQIKPPPLLLSKKDLETVDRYLLGAQKAYWIVHISTDTTAPSWGEQPISWNYFRENPYASNAPNQIVSVHLKTMDGNSSPNNQRLVLVHMGEYRGYFVERNNTISIYCGVCRTDFKLKYNQSYQVSLTPMDFSGNFCSESRLLNFNTFLE